MHWDSRVVGSFWNIPLELKLLHRSFHTTVIDSGKMYVFGGEVYDESSDNKVHLLNSFFSYSLDSGDIEKIGVTLLNDDKTYIGDVPPMSRHSMNFVNYDGDYMGDSQKFLYIFGGLVDANRQISSNDLYSFDLNRQVWAIEKQKGKIPESRHDHTISVVGNKMYLFGGTNQDKYFGKLYIFDLSSKTWIEATTIGKAPERSGHSAVVHGTSVYIFGGGNNEKLFNDIFVLDTDTLTWKEIKVASTFIPTQRVHHTASVVGNRMIVYGGTGKHFTENEVFSFDVDTLKWRKEDVDSSEQSPPALVGHSAVVSNSKIWIFGGNFERENVKLNDGQFYSLETNMKGVSPISVPSSTLSDDLGTLVNDPDVSDLIFELSDGRHYYAHKAILHVRAPYFFHCCLKIQNDDFIEIQALISFLEKKRNSTQTDNFQSRVMTLSTMDEVLEFIYTDQLPNLSRLDYATVEEIIYFSQLFKLDRLYRYCLNFMTPTSITSAPTLTSNLKKLFANTRIINENVGNLSESTNSKMDDTSMTSEEPYYNTHDLISSDDDSSPCKRHSIANHTDESVDMYDSVSDCSATTVVSDVFSTSMSESMSGITGMAMDGMSFCDVTIKVENTLISAHRCVLIARSEFFRQLLITDNPKMQYKKHLELKNIRPDIFQLLLEYLYVGDVEIPYNVALVLLTAAEDFNIPRLSIMCQQVLERKILVHNACEFLQIAEEYKLLHLRESCAYFIVHHLSQVRKVKSYRLLPSELKHELKLLRRQLKNEDNYDFENEGHHPMQNAKNKRHKKKKSNFRKSYLSQPKKPKKKKKKISYKDSNMQHPTTSYTTPYPTVSVYPFDSLDDSILLSI